MFNMFCMSYQILKLDVNYIGDPNEMAWLEGVISCQPLHRLNLNGLIQLTTDISNKDHQ